MPLPVCPAPLLCHQGSPRATQAYQRLAPTAPEALPLRRSLNRLRVALEELALAHSTTPSNVREQYLRRDMQGRGAVGVGMKAATANIMSCCSGLCCDRRGGLHCTLGGPTWPKPWIAA